MNATVTALYPAAAHTPDLVVFGINHKTAPLELRERLHVDREANLALCKRLVATNLLEEAFVLSTCNRVEIYGARPGPETAGDLLCDFLACENRISRDLLQSHSYHFHGLSAVHHGFRVASSLDSLVVGEPQITGQFKDAYQIAVEAQTVGFYLTRFWNRALSASKRVRTDTRIGAGAVSVGYAACELGRQIFESLKDKTILVIGAGEIGEEIAEHLATQAPRELIFANRGEARAKALQARFGGHVLALERSTSVLDRVDIVMSCISVETFLWSKETLEEKTKGRTRPLFLIDVSIPRSLDPELNTLDSVYLYNIDDLKEAIAQNREERMREANKAERILEEESATFYRELSDREIAPAISSLTQKFHAIKDKEVEKTLERLKHAPPETEEALRRCADAIVKKILHTPILQLKEKHAADPQGGSKLKHVIEVISDLFNLD